MASRVLWNTRYLELEEKQKRKKRKKLKVLKRFKDSPKIQEERFGFSSLSIRNFTRMRTNKTDVNEGEVEVPEDRAVQQIIEQEVKYKRELWRLQKILRRGITSNDPLPVFNRRHILLLVRRLCEEMKKSTSQLRSDMDIPRMCRVLEEATPVSHGLLCIAFSDTLHELRDFLKREMSRNGDSSTCFCQELHAERSLLPLHRLKYLKSLSCISPDHNDILTSALDGCYVAIRSLRSQSFVAEIDSILDFALNMDPPPSPYFTSFRNTYIYQELISTNKSIESHNDNVYEEIGPLCRKKKNGFFSKKNGSNKDIPAQDEFTPLTDYTFEMREIFT